MWTRGLRRPKRTAVCTELLPFLYPEAAISALSECHTGDTSIHYTLSRMIGESLPAYHRIRVVVDSASRALEQLPYQVGNHTGGFRNWNTRGLERRLFGAKSTGRA